MVGEVDFNELECYNPHLVLEEPGHTYRLTNNPAAEFTSVTTFIDKFFEPFDGPEIAANLVATHHRYQHRTVEELLDEWGDAGPHGHKVHDEIENYALGNDILSEDKARQGVQFLKDHILCKPYLKIWPELRICSLSRGLAGTVDLLVLNTRTGIYSIVDWKTNKKIDTYPFRGKTGIRPETSDFPDCKYSKYGLQMSLYRFLLEEEFGITINGQVLVHLRTDKYTLYTPPYYQETLIRMLEAA